MTVENISRELAEATLAAVRAQFAAYIEPGYGPTLFAPGEGPAGDDRWLIVWEMGAPDEWAIRAFNDDHDEELAVLASDVTDNPALINAVATTPLPECPSGVYAEPKNHLTLSLFPA